MLHGTNGSFVKYGLDVQEATIDGGVKPVGKDWGREPEDIWGTLNAEYKGVKFQGKVESEHGDYREYFINLRDAINGKAELAVKPKRHATSCTSSNLPSKATKKREPSRFSSSLINI